MKQLLDKMRARFNAATDKNDEQMPLTVRNYILIIAGLVVIILGMVLMGEKTKKNKNKKMSFRK